MIEQAVEAVLQPHDLELGAQVHLIVEPRRDPVLRRLAVLAHHDDRRLDRREHRQHQVEKYVGIGVERMDAEGLEDAAVDQHPAEQHHREGDDETPGAAHRGDLVRQSITKAGVKRRLFIGIEVDQRAGRDAPQDVLLFGLELVEVPAEEILGQLLRRSSRLVHHSRS